jgi:hypothetical protein
MCIQRIYRIGDAKALVHATHALHAARGAHGPTLSLKRANGRAHYL